MGGKYFYSRGFRMSGQYQYDGVPLDMGNSYVQADSFSSDMAYYDRVEVLRGAAGMMKGAGGTSGGVNFVRKRGQATAQTELSLSGGTWDNYRGQVDTGGPLNDSGTVRGRAVIAEQSRHFSTTMPGARTRFITVPWISICRPTRRLAWALPMKTSMQALAGAGFLAIGTVAIWLQPFHLPGSVVEHLAQPADHGVQRSQASAQ